MSQQAARCVLIKRCRRAHVPVPNVRSEARLHLDFVRVELRVNPVRAGIANGAVSYDFVAQPREVRIVPNARSIIVRRRGVVVRRRRTRASCHLQVVAVPIAVEIAFAHRVAIAVQRSVLTAVVVRCCSVVVACRVVHAAEDFELVARAIAIEIEEAIAVAVVVLLGVRAAAVREQGRIIVVAGCTVHAPIAAHDIARTVVDRGIRVVVAGLIVRAALAADVLALVVVFNGPGRIVVAGGVVQTTGTRGVLALRIVLNGPGRFVIAGGVVQTTGTRREFTRPIVIGRARRVIASPCIRAARGFVRIANAIPIVVEEHHSAPVADLASFRCELAASCIGCRCVVVASAQVQTPHHFIRVAHPIGVRVRNRNGGSVAVLAIGRVGHQARTVIDGRRRIVVARRGIRTACTRSVFALIVVRNGPRRIVVARSCIEAACARRVFALGVVRNRICRVVVAGRRVSAAFARREFARAVVLGGGIGVVASAGVRATRSAHDEVGRALDRAQMLQRSSC